MTVNMDDARLVDLHLHTLWSDGRWEPARVVAEAAARGLAVISITDHDVVGGLDEAAEAARDRHIELLAGVELTADWNGKTVHVLGHGIDPAESRLRAALERGRREMGEHVERVLSALREAGTPIVPEALDQYRVRYANGAALVLAMVQHGVLRKARNGGALLRLASREPRAYTAVEAIELIHRAGGLASLAHPARVRKDAPLLDVADLRPLVDAGLDGIEVWQIVQGARERTHYAAVADALGLVPVGGSDCHGPSREHGARIGSQRVPYAVYEVILDRIARRPDAVASRPPADALVPNHGDPPTSSVKGGASDLR